MEMDGLSSVAHCRLIIDLLDNDESGFSVVWGRV